MPTVQLGGQVGPFPDRAQQRDVPVLVVGTADYVMNGPPGDPAQLDDHVRGRLLVAMKQVLGQKMSTGQLQFRDLAEGNLGAALGEIVAASQLAQMGVQVGNMSLAFGIDGRAPAMPQARPAPQAAPPMDVHARLNIGGLKINASSNKGIDTQGLENQLKDKAKSNLIWYGAGCAVLLVVVLGLAGLGLYIWKSASSGGPASASAAAASKWDGKTPLTCDGNDVITIDGVTAKLDGTAITAAGNCKLTLVNVKITAPTGIDASGAAVVTVQGGSITSTTLSVHAAGAAQVTITGAAVSGKTKAEGAAKISGV